MKSLEERQAERKQRMEQLANEDATSVKAIGSVQDQIMRDLERQDEEERAQREVELADTRKRVAAQQTSGKKKAEAVNPFFKKTAEEQAKKTAKK